MSLSIKKTSLEVVETFASWSVTTVTPERKLLTLSSLVSPTMMEKYGSDKPDSVLTVILRILRRPQKPGFSVSLCSRKRRCLPCQEASGVVMSAKISMRSRPRCRARCKRSRIHHLWSNRTKSPILIHVIRWARDHQCSSWTKSRR